MAAGSIVIDLLMKTGAFSTDIKRAEKEIKQLGDNIKKFATVAGTATIAVASGFAYMAKQSIDNMDKMGKMAQMAGVTVESLTALGYSADLAGISQEELTGALVKLTKGMSDARQGAGEALKAFEALEIDSSSFSSADQAMEVIAEQFSDMEDGANKTALAVALFGRSGAQMIPLLNGGAEALKAQRAEAELLGLVFSTSASKSAEEFNDNLTRLKKSAEGIVTQIASHFIPGLSELSTRLISVYTEAGGVKSEFSKMLSNDIIDIAGGLAVGLATAVDVAMVLAKLMQAISGSFVQVGHDLKVLSLEAKYVVAASTVWGPTKKEVRAEIDAALKDQVAALDKVNKNYSEVWNMQGDRFQKITKEIVDNLKITKTIADSMEGIPDSEDPMGVRVKRGAPEIKDDRAEKERLRLEKERLDRLRREGEMAEKAADKLKKQLATYELISVEFERELEHNQKMLGIKDQMLGMTTNERQIQEAINTVLDSTSKKLEEITKKREDAVNAGADNSVLAVLDAEAEKVRELGEEYSRLAGLQTSASIEAQRTFSFGWNKAFSQFAEDSSNQATKAGDMFNSLTSNMASAIDNFVETGKLSFGDFAKSVIKDLIKIELQARASKLLGMAIGAIGSAFSATTTASTHSGIEYGSGGDEFSELVRYSDGGYTGAGGKYEPAGIVHKGEYVLNADATRRIGVAKLDRMNGYAEGGYVGDTGPAMQGGGGVTVNVINQSSQPVQASQSQPRFDGAKMVQDIILTDIRKNGPIAQSLRTA